tara:strand:- start:1594 stop:1875 length:282 start_codon:yes stop_codon:yes gene_type:complete
MVGKDEVSTSPSPSSFFQSVESRTAKWNLARAAPFGLPVVFLDGLNAEDSILDPGPTRMKQFTASNPCVEQELTSYFMCWTTRSKEHLPEVMG